MISKLEPVFLDTIPDEPEESILYVSIRFKVIIHSCCCGCKGKVVTPLSPARWKMAFDGKTISLYPSIGNWNFECQSHYWIENNKVEWAKTWTKDEILEGKVFERQKREHYFKNSKTSNTGGKSKVDKVDKVKDKKKRKKKDLRKKGK